MAAFSRPLKVSKSGDLGRRLSLAAAVAADDFSTAAAGNKGVSLVKRSVSKVQVSKNEIFFVI